MFLNYLKLAIRLLWRNPFYTSINVAGLAVGMVSFYILWEYSTSELKSDQYHKDADRIARIGYNWESTDDGGSTWGHTLVGSAKSTLATSVKDEFPEVESYVRILEQPLFARNVVNHGRRISLSTVDKNEDRIFKEERAVYADPNLFEFFSIPLVYGEPTQVLSEPNQVVLSQSTAQKYFGATDPRGELLKLNDTLTLKVSGVFENLPHNTHLNIDLVISNAALQTKWNTAYLAFAQTYVKLSNGAFREFENKLNKQNKRYWGEISKDFPNIRVTMFVQPLNEIAFSQSFLFDYFQPKSKSFLLTLAFISISVLIMAWVNYVNLSASQTNRRLKEVATRKVSGASGADMVKQFMVESSLINLLALTLSFTLIQLVRHPVQLFFKIQITEFSSLTHTTIAMLVFIILLGILIFSFYPAFIASAHNPRTLFSIHKTSERKRLLPSLLSIVQFSTAVVVIILGFVVALQLDLVMNKGLSKEQKAMVVIESPTIKGDDYTDRITLFKNLISKELDIISVTSSTAVLGDEMGDADFEIKRQGSTHFYFLDRNGVDENFIPTYAIKLLAGRNFISDDRADVVIISRLAAERLGFKKPEEAVGNHILAFHYSMGNVAKREYQTVEVIGVIENYRTAPYFFSSITYNDESGIVLTYGDKLFKELAAERLTLQINLERADMTIATAEGAFKKIFPGNVFTWYFLEDHVNRVYQGEEVIRNQIILFTCVTILIASIGLLGMISLKAVEKTKEIGIRKVLGAQLSQIGILLLHSTFKQAVIAFAISAPIAYYFTQQYLEKFSERIDLQWWHFGLPVALLMIIMIITVGTVVWKAAKNNPVEALKYE